MDNGGLEMCDALKLPESPLSDVGFERLCPGAASLDALMGRFR